MMTGQRSPALLLALLLAVGMLFGCRLAPAPDPVPPPPQDKMLVLYFADPKLVETGEQGEFGYMVPVNRTVAAADDPVQTAVLELIRGPLAEDGDLSPTVPAATTLIGVVVDDGVATVNLGRSFFDNYSGGATTGIMFIESMLYTLTELPGIEQVRVTIEGEPWSDGHFLWDEPWGRPGG